VKTEERPAPLKDSRHYRELGLICRQQAARHPEANWTWLSQAEKWEDLAAQASVNCSDGATHPAQKSRLAIRRTLRHEAIGPTWQHFPGSRLP
jgi:hypothetical protein